ncbi:insulin-like growth factor-binding protein complex acid labile subunit [Drosophila elegans]|uniref:insulin-like growth factor-binding protein complex acid labile subunit n=1 Tax=Drosophila elegans TaxID=30023 RepID=UPI001BC82ECB|nr:insulin-like growth factor-binding protein complex acid labile subunit [Drosophila elegans]
MSVFASLPNLVTLILQHGNLSELSNEQFSSMSGLKTLGLGNNSITRVSIGAFNGLSQHLVHLNLINCGPIRELHMQSAGTVNLKSSWIKRLIIAGGVDLLFLRKNELIYIEIGDKLSVTLVDLNENMLRTEDLQKILLGMYRLQFLDLSCSFILAAVLGITDSEQPCEGFNCTSTEMADTFYSYQKAFDLVEHRLENCSNLGVLKASPNLEILQIYNCSGGDLRVLPPLPKLSYLQVRSGNISELSDGQFAMLTALDTLELGYNSIFRVSVEAFKGLSQVWRLGMQNNNLTSLPEGVFNSLPELVDLNLARNQIATLKFKTFSENPKLKWLCLRDNPLIMVLAIPLKRLVLLDLTNCRPLEELHMHSAETVILENSGVRKMDVAGSVAILYARKNRLRYLQLDDKMSVTELYLSDNMMQTKELHNILMGMWRLQRLDLSCNILYELPVPHSDNLDEVFLLPNLRFVNLSNNMLEYLHGDSPLMSPALTHLDLSHNRIRILDPHIFKMVSNLQSLHIEWNRIRDFRYDRLYKQQRGLKFVAFFNNLFSSETYGNLTKFFKEAGVRVIEENQKPKEVSFITRHEESAETVFVQEYTLYCRPLRY